MKVLQLGAFAVPSYVASAVLAGCAAGSPGTAPVPFRPANRILASPVKSTGFETVYSFKANSKAPIGANPSDLTAFHGLLYGTTSWGGPKADGTVFAMDTLGKVRVIYRFKGGSDGMYPNGGVTVMNGVLYGTTAGGGNGCTTGPNGVEGCGTVFSLTTSGKERVLYRFTWGSDGASPIGDLTILDGQLYGVTWTGGQQRRCGDAASGCGTVFEVSASGKERILYRFKGGKDGAFPEDTLPALNGKLFGTTHNGGKRGCYSSSCGTVFDVSTSGAQSA